MKKLPLVAGSLFLALLYNIPQVEHLRLGFRGAAVLQADETYYAARVTRVLQGQPGVGNPWLWEHASDPNLVPTLPELAVAAPAALLNAGAGLQLNAGAILVASRSVLPVIAFLFLHRLLLLLAFGELSAAVVAAWILSEPGLMAYKPLAGILLGIRELPLDRFLNPLFSICLFFATTWLAARAFLLPASRQGRRIQGLAPAALAGIALGLNFYTSVYYWTHLVAGLMIFAALSRNPRRWPLLLAGAGFALLTVIPYAIQSTALRHQAEYDMMPWRLGLLLRDRGLYLLGHRTLWIFAGLGVAPAFFGSEAGRFVGAFALGGLACYFSSLVTGISFQNFHWHYTLAPLLFIGTAMTLRQAAAALDRRLPRIPIAVRRGLGGVALIAVVVSPVRAAGRWYPALRQQAPTSLADSDQAYFEAWGWLRQHASSDSVVLASLSTMELVPLRAGLHVWSSLHMTPEFVSNEEILSRNQALWLLEGLEGPTLASRIRPAGPLPVAQWIYGMPRELAQEFKSRGLPPIGEEETRYLADQVSSLQARLRPEELTAKARNFRLDWLVRGPNETQMGTRPERFLRFGRSVQLGAVRIDRVLGWR